MHVVRQENLVVPFACFYLNYHLHPHGRHPFLNLVYTPDAYVITSLSLSLICYYTHHSPVQFQVGRGACIQSMAIGSYFLPQLSLLDGLKHSCPSSRCRESGSLL